MITYQEHTTLPAWELAVWIDGKPQPSEVARWGGKDTTATPPAIGTRINVTMNRCGPAVVTGYFTGHGWLGVLCTLLDAPDWHRRQNDGDPTGHVFGPEFEVPVPSGPRIITWFNYGEWSAYRDGYEEDESRYGHGRSEEEAIADLLALEAEVAR